MITFSETIRLAQEALIEVEIHTLALEVTIIRDVKGRIRLLLKGLQEVFLNIDMQEKLKDALVRKLGDYYAEDLWIMDPNNKKTIQATLFKKVEDEREEINWIEPVSGVRIFILERHIAKKTWTDKNPNKAVWDKRLVEQKHKPAVISFYSFKGGSGRTTTLASTAINLSRMGKKVVIVDFDLEAPGAGSIFFPSETIAYGTIDYLLEKPIQKDKWPLRMHIQVVTDQSILGDEGKPISVVPAGRVDKSYLEKLARLDFQGITENGMEDTIKELLIELNAIDRPDFILVDSRAGFHDIGGMALTRMAHTAVLFGTHSEQTWAGLSFAVRKAANLPGEEAMPIIMVHALAPGPNIAGWEEELLAYREKSYDTFLTNYYSEEEVESVNMNNADEPFYPITISYNDFLRGEVALYIDEKRSEESFSKQLKPILDPEGPYAKLAEKLIQIFETDEEGSSHVR